MITYWEFKPYEGGYEIRQVKSFDPAGWIMDWMKELMSSRLANGLKILVNYLNDGTIPKPII